MCMSIYEELLRSYPVEGANLHGVTVITNDEDKSIPETELQLRVHEEPVVTLSFIGPDSEILEDIEVKLVGSTAGYIYPKQALHQIVLKAIELMQQVLRDRRT